MSIAGDFELVKNYRLELYWSLRVRYVQISMHQTIQLSFKIKLSTLLFCCYRCMAEIELRLGQLSTKQFVPMKQKTSKKKMYF